MIYYVKRLITVADRSILAQVVDATFNDGYAESTKVVGRGSFDSVNYILGYDSSNVKASQRSFWETYETHDYSYGPSIRGDCGSDSDEYWAGVYDEYNSNSFSVEWKRSNWDEDVYIPRIVKRGSQTYEKCLNEVLDSSHNYYDETKNHEYYDYLKILYELGETNRDYELNKEAEREYEEKKYRIKQDFLQVEYQNNIELYQEIEDIRRNYKINKMKAVGGFVVISLFEWILDNVYSGRIGGYMFSSAILVSVFLYTIPYIIIRLVLYTKYKNRINDIKKEYFVKNYEELTDKKIKEVLKRD